MAETRKFTLAHLNALLADKIGAPHAKTVAAWWANADTIPHHAAPIEKGIAERLDAIVTTLKSTASHADTDAILAAIKDLGVATPTPMPTPTPTPGKAPDPVLTYVAKPLPPIPFDSKPNDWNTEYHAEDYKLGFVLLPFKPDHVFMRGKDLVLRIDNKGCPGVQAVEKYRYGKRGKGMWETEVTLPSEFRPGVVNAAMWLWDQNLGIEINFEIAGDKEISAVMHLRPWSTGFPVMNAAGLKALAGQKVRFGIFWDHINDVIDLYINCKWVGRFDRRTQEKWLPPQKGVRPFFQMWMSDSYPAWTNGKYSSRPFKDGEFLENVYHGHEWRETLQA